MRKYIGLDDRAVARGMALTAAWLRDSTFREKFVQGMRRFRLEPNEQRFLARIYSARRIGFKLYWSNRAVRRASTEALISAFLDDLESHELRKRWFATFAWDDGITPERNPAVDLIRLKSKVDKAMRKYGLDGVGIVEVDTTTPIAGEGKLLLFHVHVYCWTKVATAFDHVTAAKELMASRRFPNCLGAPSVNFKPVSLNEISVAQIAGYLTKYPPGAKNRIELRNKPGRFTMRSTLRGFTPDSVVRLAEVMSHLDARDVIFSVGASGRELRQRWYGNFMGQVRQRVSQRQIEADDELDVAECWRSIRASNGSTKMKSCRIITRSAQRRSEGML